MLRLARNSDFRRLVKSYPGHSIKEEDISLLKEKYPDEAMPEGMTWGLKQIGYLHILDFLTKKGSRSVLEAGAGFNFYLPNHIGEEVSYTSVDSRGFYEPKMLELMAKHLKRGKTVDALLGQFSADLADGEFDACVSVSVLEHVKPDAIESICRDMWRLLAPGGYTLHSIDLPAGMIVPTIRNWREALDGCGFIFEEDRVDYDLKEGDWIADPAHAESLAIVMRFYFGYLPSIWTSQLNEAPTENMHTVLLAARKPR